jgi:hypothetical protein
VLPDDSTGCVLVLQPENCPGASPPDWTTSVVRAGRVWRTFCRHGTNFIACWRDRGTILIGAASLSPVTKLVAGTGAVSWYKLSRSQKFITVQDLNYVQMSVSGCMGHYKFVLGAGAKARPYDRTVGRAKTVTNNLPILSVLAVRCYCLSNV